MGVLNSRTLQRFGAVALAGLIGCNGCQKGADTAEVRTREACVDQDPLRQVFWGDLHIHTRHSFDAWIYDVRATPDDAYAYAKGEVIYGPPLDAAGQGTVALQLERPLDFAAVTDHAAFLGEISACTDETSTVYETETCVDYREATALSIQIFGTKLAAVDPERFEELCGDGGIDCLAQAGDVWRATQDAAEAAYDRSDACSFTSFVGYEWSGATNISNFHRNVIFRNYRVPELPTSYFEAPTARELWMTLEDDCLNAGTGCDVLAIPHNSNMSNGQQFQLEVPFGADATEEAERRAALEPLFEVFQHKGDAECIEGLSGYVGDPDELCHFEKIRLDEFNDCGDTPGSGAMAGFGCVSNLDFLRGILLEGLKKEREVGVNPFPLGVVANTDTHAGTSGRVNEAAFSGHLGSADDTPEERVVEPGFNPGSVTDNPGGLMGVWAESNDRDALFDAMLRKETFGTSGPRIPVRMFGGEGWTSALCEDVDWVDTADSSGVPMGGSLNSASKPIDTAPSFIVSALQDAGTSNYPGTPLQRIQIVKGWVDDAGEGHIRVVDVAGEDNGASVDLETCETQGTGAASLCGVWTDDDFDASEDAFYYARVLENPVCRWSWRDCLAMEEDERPAYCDGQTISPTIQERAWTSPVWWSAD